jgi:hypothetical protein
MDQDWAGLERVAQLFRHEMWSSVIPEAIAEQGIEVQRFGPVQATAFREEPEVPSLNLIQGAAEPEAVESGHLADAVEWMRAREVDYRVPVAEGRPQSAAAEEWLGGKGYERGGTWTTLTREVGPVDLADDAGIEVFELGEEEADGEGFSWIVAQALELPIMAETLCFLLPTMESWRCYTAALAAENRVVAAGAMLIDGGVAQLGLDATLESDRGRGCNKALLRRRLLDAAEAGCHTVFAELGECEPAGLAAARHNLLAAGFAEAYVSRNWQRPALSPAGAPA